MKQRGREDLERDRVEDMRWEKWCMLWIREMRGWVGRGEEMIVDRGEIMMGE